MAYQELLNKIDTVDVSSFANRSYDSDESYDCDDVEDRTEGRTPGEITSEVMKRIELAEPYVKTPSVITGHPLINKSSRAFTHPPSVSALSILASSEISSETSITPDSFNSSSPPIKSWAEEVKESEEADVDDKSQDELNDVTELNPNTILTADKNETLGSTGNFSHESSEEDACDNDNDWKNQDPLGTHEIPPVESIKLDSGLKIDDIISKCREAGFHKINSLGHSEDINELYAKFIHIMGELGGDKLETTLTQVRPLITDDQVASVISEFAIRLSDPDADLKSFVQWMMGWIQGVKGELAVKTFSFMPQIIGTITSTARDLTSALKEGRSLEQMMKRLHTFVQRWNQTLETQSESADTQKSWNILYRDPTSDYNYTDVNYDPLTYYDLNVIDLMQLRFTELNSKGTGYKRLGRDASKSAQNWIWKQSLEWAGKGCCNLKFFTTGIRVCKLEDFTVIIENCLNGSCFATDWHMLVSKSRSLPDGIQEIMTYKMIL